MPKLNEIKNLKGRKDRSKFIWLACQNCKKERWVRLDMSLQPKFTGLCFSCWSKKPKPNPKGTTARNWKGGRRLNKKGYISIVLPPDNPFYSMCNSTGAVPEHRLIMANYLGRCLHPMEIVHHKNGIKSDNRIENLALLPSQTEHLILTQLFNRVLELEEENALLKQQIQNSE